MAGAMLAKDRLSVIVPCKNERMNIRPCVESFRGIADEIIIADSGSTDGTLDIVRSMGGCRIIEREYIHSGNFKNWAIPHATHDWVLIVDADERIAAKLCREIENLLQMGPSEDGYWIYRENYFLGHRIRHCGWGKDKVLRLFRRDLGRYVGETDHAEIEISSGKTGVLKQRMDHFTYWTYDQYFQKFQRYTKQRAELWHAERKSVKRLRMVLSPPLRFLQLYVLRLGFLDGMAGLQVSMLTAFSSFMKQARLWEIEHAMAQPDPEAEHMNGETDSQRNAA
jgi:glycosyltransferase involved in cell wall biosynthesis